MPKSLQRTARYKIQKCSEGNRYQFFCDISGALACTTNPIRLISPEQELLMAWEEEGKRYFNRCHRCGRWVTDVMYNADTLACVSCSPWEEQPTFCSQCGVKVGMDEVFCHKCHVRLRYGEGNDANEDEGKNSE